MAVILASKDINSTIDKIWNIISNVDKDPEYWHGTRSIKNIKKEGNTIEREVIISFKNYNCKEIVTLYNKNKITIEMIEGPISGRKTITLEKLDENITRINVIWDIHFKGFISIFTIFVKKHLLKGIVDAITRIVNNIAE